MTCKNCGGSLSLDRAAGCIVCDSCGVAQSLKEALSGAANSLLYRAEEVPQRDLVTYQRALSMMTNAQTEASLKMAAELFEGLDDMLGAASLAAECRERAELFKAERLYNAAIAGMESGDPVRIETAMRQFEALTEYQDSLTKAEECVPLLQTAKELEQERRQVAEQQRLREEKRRRRQAQRRKLLVRLFGSVALTVAVCCVLGHAYLYSSDRIRVTLSPDEEAFLTETYSGYVFHYDAKLQNNGLLDVQAVEGTVIFEKNNEILVDTTISFYNYSSAVVRAHKSSKFTWDLTVKSEDTALALYETAFEDLVVRVDITGITYTNGKTKTY